MQPGIYGGLLHVTCISLMTTQVVSKGTDDKLGQWLNLKYFSLYIVFWSFLCCSFFFFFSWLVQLMCFPIFSLLVWARAVNGAVCPCQSLRTPNHRPGNPLKWMMDYSGLTLSPPTPPPPPLSQRQIGYIYMWHFMRFIFRITFLNFDLHLHTVHCVCVSILG